MRCEYHRQDQRQDADDRKKKPTEVKNGIKAPIRLINRVAGKITSITKKKEISGIKSQLPIMRGVKEISTGIAFVDAAFAVT